MPILALLALFLSTPPETVSYRRDVVPILARAGCNTGPCHGNAAGKGGFKLSLRGESPADDWLALTHDTHARRINPARPDTSLLLLKPTGQVPHEGGLRFAVSSDEYTTLRAWIAAGAPDDVADVAPLVALTVEPADRLITPVATSPAYAQQLQVNATFADGTQRDVTRQATFDLSDPTRADIDGNGQVTASRPGEVAVAVRYLDHRATSRLAFLADQPNYAWTSPPSDNLVDSHVFPRWTALRVQPAPPCDDPTFLRRATLDTIGRLPTPDEARAFLSDPQPETRRSRLVDSLLQRPEFADFWALKWADLLRNEEKTMGAKGAWIFQRWLRDQVANDVPLDQFARDLISARGSTWKNPPASFHRTNRDPTAAAEAVGQLFLGVRLQCARCHNHPFDTWTQNDYYGLASTFANVKRKQIDNVRRDTFDKHEINGDEIIYLEGPPALRQPRSGDMMNPRAPGGPELGLASGDSDALDNLADWLTRDNRQFARVLANRVWFHLLGRGIVEPVDDFRESNPPANPELLEALTDHLIAHGYRLKPLVQLILNSETYRRAAQTLDHPDADDPTFARARVKLLPAEVLLDAVSQALDVPESFRAAPDATRATQLPGVRIGGTDFLKTFGKPDRLLTCECERSEAITLAQAFQLINGQTLRKKLEASDNRLGRLLASGADTNAILDELYLAALTRLPTEVERAGMKEHVDQSDKPRAAWEDIAWALLNSKEFLLRH